MSRFRQGPWLQDEEELFISLLPKGGPRNWVRLSQQMGTRSPKQCRERYHVLRPRRQRSRTPQRDYFIPSDGIAPEVIQADIKRYLGADANVSIRNGSEEKNRLSGYRVTSYRPLTRTMIEDMKFDSQRWKEELKSVDDLRRSKHTP